MNTALVITLNIDVNGILKVTALEKNTGLNKSITIDNAISRFEDEQIEQAKQRVQSLFAEPKSKTVNNVGAAVPN